MLIADNYLDAENNADAYSYITKAAQYIDGITNKYTILKYKYCYARVHDANLKFSQAASLYLELSHSEGVVDVEAQAFLTRAVTCTILAPAGTQRSRLLTLLYKDDRTRMLEHYELLEKMYLERFIRLSEVKKFEEGLQPHQKGMTAENYTVLQKAVLEHNVLALSKIYNNISFDQLTKVLELPLDKAELLVATMISEGKIKAHINQSDRFVYFDAGMERTAIWSREGDDPAVQRHDRQRLRKRQSAHSGDYTEVPASCRQVLITEFQPKYRVPIVYCVYVEKHCFVIRLCMLMLN